MKSPTGKPKVQVVSQNSKIGMEDVSMILSEKITEERKKNGWSQEELAEKLSVSRQAVSKWESAQSTPDLQKIIRLAELFQVSTDYLLRDEVDAQTNLGSTEYGSMEEIPVRNVSMEEANEFLNWKRKLAPRMAGAVALCILSPVLLIFLSGLADSHIWRLRENMATGVGLTILMIMVAAAVFIFITGGLQGKPYEYLEFEQIETAYGVTGLVKEKRKEYESGFLKGMAIGVVLCILAVIPLFMVMAMEAPDYVVTASVSLLLILVACGVYLIVRVCIIKGSYDMLLQEGDYSRKEKQVKKKKDTFASIYWCTATAIYLGWSFWTQRWDFTWLVWPVAGVLFGAVSAIISITVKGGE